MLWILEKPFKHVISESRDRVKRFLHVTLLTEARHESQVLGSCSAVECEFSLDSLLYP
jgi:hypothetical protein